MTLPIIGEIFLTLNLVALLGSLLAKDRYVHSFYWAALLCAILAFITLAYAHFISDMRLLIVLENTHALLPWHFKLGAVWGSHEGSMFLWVVMLSGSLFVLKPYLNNDDMIAVTRMQSFLLFGFLLFIVIASNPFKIVEVAQGSGDDLNPVLQDPSLLIHPPLLYLGTSMASIPFQLSLLSLFRGKLSLNILQAMHKSATFSWFFLTLGLALGSLWAYYELGWGGFWFWDPVETVALIPWLLLTVLIHQVIRYQYSNKQSLWVILTGLLPFWSILLGTTLVRSGWLNSVHSFAVDLNRGFLLSILFLIMTVLAIACCIRFLKFQKQKISMWEMIMNAQGMVLVILSMLLFLGVVTPVVMSLTGVSVNLEFGFFNNVFLVFGFVVLIMMTFHDDASKAEIISKIMGVSFVSIWFFIALILGCWGLLWASNDSGIIIWPLVVIWIVLGTFWRVDFKTIRSPKIAMIFAHLGIAILMVGIIGATYGKQSFDVKFASNRKVIQQGVHFQFLKNENTKSPLWKGKKLYFKVDDYCELSPERRYYSVRSVIHDEVSIAGGLFSHYYASILSDEKPYMIRVEYKPFINLIWLGAFIMACGAALAFLLRFRNFKKDFG